MKRTTHVLGRGGQEDRMERVVFMVAVSLAFAARGATAQVVQLPTFNFFGISTTVSVPDSGAGFVGGNSISSMGRFERGLPVFGHVPIGGRPFGSRAIAGRAQASSVSVSATIHDFDAMDEALLGGGLATRPLAPLSAPRASAGKGAAGGSAAGRTASPIIADPAGRVSVAELRRQQASRQATATDDGRSDLERARVLLAEDKTGAARVYLQRARKRADLALRSEIDVELRKLQLGRTLAGVDARAAVER
jgi:hypothetical protein